MEKYDVSFQLLYINEMDKTNYQYYDCSRDVYNKHRDVENEQIARDDENNIIEFITAIYYTPNNE